MIDVSGFGLGITVLALQSFPQGFSLSAFADDQDPLIVEENEPSGYEMLYDGSLFAYDKATAIKVTVALIPGSADDINCKILLQARKSGISLIPLPDTTSMSISYADNGLVVFSNGTIISGPLADSVTQQGRKKANKYTFAFGSFAGAQSATEVVAAVVQTALSIL